MGKRLAMVLAVSRYDRLNPLPGCDTDAKAMAALFRCAGKFDEVLVLDGTATYAEVKQSVMDFFRNAAKTEVDELVFYFSGHGGIVDSDFRFVLRDFDAAKPNSTSISNSELDGWARSVRPGIYCKIVDACHAGMPYIKDSDVMKTLLDKGKGSFDRCYFFYSSQQDQNSFANAYLSRFTQALVESVLEFPAQSIGYNDLASALADRFKDREAQTPYFVSQANLTEVFVEITEAMRGTISALLPAKTPAQADPAKVPSQPSIIERVKANAELFLSKEEAMDLLSKFRDEIEALSLGDGFDELYRLRVEEIPLTDSGDAYIANWLKDHGIARFFARLEYSTYYIDITGNPLSDAEVTAMRSRSSLYQSLHGAFYQQKQKLDGYSLTELGPWQVLKVTAEPMFPNLSQLVLRITYVLGAQELVFFSAVFPMRRSGWSTFEKSAKDTWVVSTFSRSCLSPATVVATVARVFKEALEQSVADALRVEK